MPQQAKPVLAGLAGAVFGGVSGALIGSSFSGESGAVLGGFVGAAYWGIAEAITDLRRQPGQLKPLVHRILSTTLLGAALGAVLSNWLSPLLTGLLTGLFIGLMTFGPRKFLVATVVGLILGLVAASIPVNGALLGGAVVLLYRLVELLLFRNAEPLQVVGERVPPDQARFVVPFEAHTGFIGTDYMTALARETNGAFQRNAPGIGLFDSFDTLKGPNFDPARVDPRIRHFYEHTSQYRLVIVPDWNRLMKPFYRLFKQSIAQQIGQANLPFDIEEAQRGVVSYIDTIDYAASPDDPIRTLRGWIRAFEATGEAIYVGIYTVVRHEDVGYVSVGFPLPESNFTATLLPYHVDHGLLLKTHHTGLSFPGHYISDIDNDTGALTIFKLPTLGEEIEVYLQGDQLKTDHRFYLGGFKFLTLYYSIEPKAGE
ncbi:MAG: complement resistance protein TraT [Anaerolineae bacterium]|nr:complement resistance protein TraT [Anaerolineae bacterium]